MTTRTLRIATLRLRRRPDAEVFSRAGAGDPEAFAEVYRRFRSRVFGFCLARLLDSGAAEDATQEVFMRVLRAAPTDIERPLAWLFTTARNVCIDVARRRSARPEDLVESDDSRLDGPGEDAADALGRKEDGRAVLLTLRRMRPRYRTALVLREVHGQSSADIAEALDTTPGAIDTLVCRARDAFGREYADVLGLAEECRIAVESVYRRTGSGLDPVAEQRLDAHLASCSHCAAEDRQARDTSRLSALLPLLVPGGSAAGWIARIIAAADGVGAAVSTLAPASGPLGHTASKVVAVAIALAMTVPLAGVMNRDLQAGRQLDSALVLGLTSVSPARVDGAVDNGHRAAYAAGTPPHEAMGFPSGEHDSAPFESSTAWHDGFVSHEMALIGTGTGGHDIGAGEVTRESGATQVVGTHASPVDSTHVGATGYPATRTVRSPASTPAHQDATTHSSTTVIKAPHDW